MSFRLKNKKWKYGLSNASGENHPYNSLLTTSQMTSQHLDGAPLTILLPCYGIVSSQGNNPLAGFQEANPGAPAW